MSESKIDPKHEKIDYLEVDTHIPGQNYVCMSFLSPESLIQNKDGFKCCKFLQSYCKEEKLKFEEVYQKYQDFCYKFEDKLQRDFDEQNNFQTSLRGIKIRGVYDTKEAAEAQAKIDKGGLKKGKVEELQKVVKKGGDAKVGKKYDVHNT